MTFRTWKIVGGFILSSSISTHLKISTHWIFWTYFWEGEIGSGWSETHTAKCSKFLSGSFCYKKGKWISQTWNPSTAYSLSWISNIYLNHGETCQFFGCLRASAIKPTWSSKWTMGQAKFQHLTTSRTFFGGESTWFDIPILNRQQWGEGNFGSVQNLQPRSTNVINISRFSSLQNHQAWTKASDFGEKITQNYLKPK